MKEIWKNLDFTSDYLVSNLGRVKSIKRNKEIILKPAQYHKIKNYNESVVLYIDKKKYVYPLKNLIYETFVKKIPKGYRVYNKDNNEHNNNINNLMLLSEEDVMFLKINRHNKAENKSTKSFTYIVDGVNVGKLKNLLKLIPEQTRANVSRRFIAWEKDKYHDDRGLLFGNHWCIRNVTINPNKRYLRMQNCLEKINNEGKN